MISIRRSRPFRIFIDGEAGTTGLSLVQRLEALPEDMGLEVLHIEPRFRRDAVARREMMERADITVLCLPDAAAQEAAALAAGTGTRVLDASSSHRTHKDWVYGLAELDPGQPLKIGRSDRVSNPGCYASGAVALLRPLLKSGMIASETPLSIFGVSGYTGGGKTMITAYEEKQAPEYELYSLGLAHKHLPEIVQHAGLSRTPLLVPSVGNFPQGMVVVIPLHAEYLKGESAERNAQSIMDLWREAYHRPVSQIRVEHSGSRLSPLSEAGAEGMKLDLHHSDSGGNFLLTATFDNLGKGAAGAAVQNVLLMSGRYGTDSERNLVRRILSGFDWVKSVQ